MKIIDTIVEFFGGKKTYIVGIIMIVLGILQDNQELILQGILVLTGRAAIAKIK